MEEEKKLTCHNLRTYDEFEKYMGRRPIVEGDVNMFYPTKMIRVTLEDGRIMFLEEGIQELKKIGGDRGIIYFNKRLYVIPEGKLNHLLNHHKTEH